MATERTPSSSAASHRHYFVINQHGQSASRRGPFVSAAAAKAWVHQFYAQFPCWIIAAEYAGDVEFRPLDENGAGVSVKEG